METKFNFNSQVCTDRVQSERLLALGLKPETADLHYYYGDKKWKMGEGCNLSACKHLYPNYYIPAWSLHRLIELYKCVGDTSLWNLDDVNYDRLIQCIGLAIKHNSFNKEYLI